MNIYFRTSGLVLMIILGVCSVNTTLAVESQNTTPERSHSHKHEDDKPREDADHQHNHTVTSESNVKSVVTDKDEHEVAISLSEKNIKLAGINVEVLRAQKRFNTVYAPGEVKANGYKSYIVSPRTDSVVINRHASLGDHVTAGQALVTLFSETMAQAQADFLIASSNWTRAKKLGSDTVSERTLVEAENIYKAAYGKLVAFGLTDEAINKQSRQDNSTFGQYELIAEYDGVILRDDFILGQRIEAGETIMLLADEKQLWVEANIAPNKELDIALGSPALIDFNGTKFQAKVIQEAHTIDPVTRTRIVRLSVSNTEHNLHSGMFVKVYFQFESNGEVIAVPEEALIRNTNGNWTVFIEDHPNEFKSIEVSLGRAFGGYREIFGITPGAKVVTHGAFFVASEIAKGGFDPHNH